MANNYEFQAQTMDHQEEGACALEPRLESMDEIPNEQEHEQQQAQEQQQQKQFENVALNLLRTVSEIENVHQQKPYTNIAVKGQKIKSKLNPLAQEFYPSYMRHPKNGYITNTIQMPNAAAIAAAATAAQYGYLDYDCNDYADWPQSYEYDIVRYMDYERFMTGQMQRSNTTVPLVRNNYSGSGSAAPPSVSTSFQDQQSFEQIRKHRSFIRSYSSTSYNLRKHHKSSKENCRENMRSWYIDKKAEEKRMESWKNNSTAEAYQDAIPSTSSKDEFFETQSPQSDMKSVEKDEAKVDCNERAISPLFDQQHTPRAEGGTTQISPHKIKSAHKSKKENLEVSKKKLIMLYPAKRDESDLTQSSQDSIFTQPNSIEYTSDESFLTQLSSIPAMRTNAKILNDVQEKTEAETLTIETENTDSLEDFEMTTKPSEPTIFDSSESVSPISVIEQEKPRRAMKSSKPFLVPRTAVNRQKKDGEKKLSQKPKSLAMDRTSLAQKTTRSIPIEKEATSKEVGSSSHKKTTQLHVKQDVEKEIMSKEVERSCHRVTTHMHLKEDKEKEITHKEVERSSPRATIQFHVKDEKESTHKEVDKNSQKVVKHIREPKETKAVIIPRGKYMSPNSESSKEDAKVTHKSNRAPFTTTNESELKPTQKFSRVAAGVETTTATTKTAAYTGTIPKNKELTKTKEYTQQTLHTSQKTIPKSNATTATTKTRELITSPNRKVQTSTEDQMPKTTVRSASRRTSTSSSKEEKPKLELWIQGPPNGIVANRVQIFANSSKPATIGKVELQSYEKSTDATYKKQTLRTPLLHIAGADRKIHKTIVENALPPPRLSTTPTSILKRSSASTAVTATSTVAATATVAPAVVVDKCSVVSKSIVKTQMRSTTNVRGTSPTKKQNINKAPSSPKKEATESKKIKSVINTGSRSVQPSSSKSIKTARTKIPMREKSSSLKAVKASIGSDGDNNAKVISSRSCISLRHSGRKTLTSKPSVTSTKAVKKTSTANNKASYSRETIASTLRNMQKEKRRNPYTDPGSDYKIIQSTFLHK